LDGRVTLKYDISEIFYSFQGEGFLQGLPMIFVRLAGCNLRCPFCDTVHAFEKGSRLGVRSILDRLIPFGCKRVCITGGEPFIQDLGPLVKALKEKRFWVTAETNGTAWQEVPLDWLTVSPKAEARKLLPKGYDRRFLDAASEFKYVISSNDDFSFIDKRIKQPVILQPVDNDLGKAREIWEYLKKNPGRNWYLRLQNHKITGSR
jgi:organic radical activating enzyme